MNFFQNSTNLYQVYKPKKIDKVSFMMSLHNLVEEHATQIQAVHSKNKEIQIALSTKCFFPFQGGGGM